MAQAPHMAGGTSIFNNPPPKRKAKLPTLCTLAAKTEIQIGDCTLLHSPPAPAPHSPTPCTHGAPHANRTHNHIRSNAATSTAAGPMRHVSLIAHTPRPSPNESRTPLERESTPLGQGGSAQEGGSSGVVGEGGGGEVLGNSLIVVGEPRRHPLGSGTRGASAVSPVGSAVHLSLSKRSTI